MHTLLRAATLSDSPGIADVLLASRAAFLPYAPSPHPNERVRAWVRDVLLPTENVTIAARNDQLVGFIAVHAADGFSWISQLYVRPGFVGLGIGTVLLARAMATAPRPIRLYTFQQNAGARRFYERNGFVPIRLSDGSANEEQCPDVLYERTT